MRAVAVAVAVGALGMGELASATPATTPTTGAQTSVGVTTGSTSTAAKQAPGDWVLRAQRRLNRLGCGAGAADGQMGSQTRAAFMRFQAVHRLAQTGGMNAVTRKRLYRPKAAGCLHRAVPARSGNGRRIVLSQRQNYVWLVGPAGRVVAEGGVIDNPGELSPGIYTTGEKCGRAGRISRNTDGGSLFLYNFVRFGACGIGFHQIPVYMSSGNQMHDNWLLGTNLTQSHGCIRVSRRMSAQMWDFTVRSAVVRVVTG